MDTSTLGPLPESEALISQLNADKALQDHFEAIREDMAHHGPHHCGPAVTGVTGVTGKTRENWRLEMTRGL